MIEIDSKPICGICNHRLVEFDKDNFYCWSCDYIIRKYSISICQHCFKPIVVHVNN